MDDQRDDHELANRLARHFDRAGAIRVDVRQIAVPPRRRSFIQLGSPRTRVVAVAAAIVVVTSAALTSDFLGRLPDRDLAPSPSVPRTASPAVPGCGTAETPYADPDFNPVRLQRGPLQVPTPLIDSGQVIESPDQIPAGFDLPTTGPDGKSLQLILYGIAPMPPGEVSPSLLRLFYASGPVTGTYSEFIVDGGVAVTQDPEAAWDVATIASHYDSTSHGYSLVAIGPHEGIVSLGDPVVRDDVRPWGIYWDDGTQNWSIVGAADPIQLITMARSLYCG